MAQISYVSVAQWKSVLKAVVYAFLSGFTATLTLFAADFIKAAQGGEAAVNTLVYALIAGALVGGINGAAVFVKKLFTDPNA
jgi:hypothetical protein